MAEVQFGFRRMYQEVVILIMLVSLIALIPWIIFFIWKLRNKKVYQEVEPEPTYIYHTKEWNLGVERGTKDPYGSNWGLEDQESTITTHEV